MPRKPSALDHGAWSGPEPGGSISVTASGDETHTMKDEPLTRQKDGSPVQDSASKAAARTRPEHAPTVIHDPTADETLLARWLRESLERGPRFWLPVALAAVGLVALWLVLSNLRSGPSGTSETWNELLVARDVEQQVKIGEAAEGDVAGWALLQAAEERYREAFNDLPANRDAALPLLNSAHDLFQEARSKAPAESSARRFAAMGMARTLEARGDLEAAIAAYQDVVQSFPKTDEARRAEELIVLLKKPESVTFYQKFSAFKPTEVTLPPRGTTSLDLPGLPADHPPLDGPAIPAPGLDQPAKGLAPLLPLDLGDTPPATPAPTPTTTTPAPADPAAAAPQPEPPAEPAAKP